MALTAQSASCFYYFFELSFLEMQCKKHFVIHTKHFVTITELFLQILNLLTKIILLWDKIILLVTFSDRDKMLS